MVQSAAKTVDAYLKELPKERREVMSKVRDVLRKSMPKGYEEHMAGMIVWSIPLERYPNTYNGDPLAYAGLAAQKNNYSLYLMGCYMNPKQTRALQDAFRKAGKKLDMGKSCVRFKSAEDLELDAIAKVIASCPVEDYISIYEKTRPSK